MDNDSGGLGIFLFIFFQVSSSPFPAQSQGDYGTASSTFHLPFMVCLCGLVVAVEMKWNFTLGRGYLNDLMKNKK